MFCKLIAQGWTLIDPGGTAWVSDTRPYASSGPSNAHDMGPYIAREITALKAALEQIVAVKHDGSSGDMKWAQEVARAALHKTQEAGS